MDEPTEAVDGENEGGLAGAPFLDAANRAMLVGQPCFDPPPIAAVSAQHDFALDADAEPIELRVVGRCAVIYIDQGTIDVAIRSVGTEWRQCCPSR